VICDFFCLSPITTHFFCVFSSCISSVVIWDVSRAVLIRSGNCKHNGAVETSSTRRPPHYHTPSTKIRTHPNRNKQQQLIGKPRNVMTTDDSALIDEILRAETHYDALGADMDSDAAALRKAYLRRSLKVHPDKCPDPRAKGAFQRLAQAWRVLSEDASRAQYDRALKRGRTDPNDDYDYDDDDHRPRETYYYAAAAGPPPPSMQEALFLFATVVGSMMGSGGNRSIHNVTEALYWGERLLSRNTADRGTDERPLSTEDKVTMAMALGSGLKIASDTARGLGFRSGADRMERAGQLAQMASVGVVVADQPSVRRVIQRGTDSLGKFKNGIDVVRTVLHNQQQQQQQQQQHKEQSETRNDSNQQKR